MTRNRAVLVEVCVDAVESAMAAQAGGAGRVELCVDLLEGGVTPSAGTICLARRHLTIPLHVLIRPRGGDFCYSPIEFEVMKVDVEMAKAHGADGIVVGVLHEDGAVDAVRTAELIALARPLAVTFHRAFDMTADPFAALETLVELGVERVLTSGQEASALEGVDLIAELVRRADGRIRIMAGGGINERNAARIVAQTGVTEVHASARTTVESRMQHRHGRAFMGGALRPPEFTWSVASAERVAAMVRALEIA